MSESVKFCAVGPCGDVVSEKDPQLDCCAVHVARWRASEEYRLWRKRLAEDCDAPEASYRGWLLAFVQRVEAEERALRQ